MRSSLLLTLLCLPLAAQEAIPAPGHPVTPITCTAMNPPSCFDATGKKIAALEPPRPGDYLYVGPDGVLRKVDTVSGVPTVHDYYLKGLQMVRDRLAQATADLAAAGHTQPIDTEKVKAAAEEVAHWQKWLTDYDKAKDLATDPEMEELTNWNCPHQRAALGAAYRLYREARLDNSVARLDNSVDKIDKQREQDAQRLWLYFDLVARGCGVPERELVEYVAIVDNYSAIIQARMRAADRKKEAAHAQ